MTNAISENEKAYTETLEFWSIMAAVAFVVIFSIIVIGFIVKKKKEHGKYNIKKKYTHCDFFVCEKKN